MLVLSRKREQRIFIGDDIIITVLDIVGPQIRLGIEAPANMTIHREEVWVEIQRNKEAQR